MKALVSCARNLLWLEQLENSDALVPLKYVTQINAEALSESTSSEFSIKYIDIGSVDSTGRISQVDEFTFENSPSRARRRVKQGDTIVSTVRTYLKAIAYIDQDDSSLIASTGFAVLCAIRSILYPRYLYYWMRSDFVVDEICARSVGVSYPATNASEIGSIPIPTPPIEQQKSIATFLDRKTAAIDTLIAKKQRLIQLLEEKRTALINQAVTKGLNPNAPMKDSGIPWIGEIPEHWEVKKLQYIARLKSGDNITAGMIKEEDEFPVYGGNGLRGYFYEYTHDGDYVLIGRQGALCGNIHYAKGRFWASEHAVVVSPITQLETFWLGELLRAMNLNQYSVSAAQPGLSVETISRLKIPFPTIAEQKLIASFLKHKNSYINSLQSRLKKSIEKLQEYRRSLITAAVTGKLEIEEDNAA